MSLSKIIAKLEHDESINFTRELMAVRFVVKKGNERERHKEVTIMVEQGNFDVLSFEVERALQVIRK